MIDRYAKEQPNSSYLPELLKAKAQMLQAKETFRRYVVKKDFTRHMKACGLSGEDLLHELGVSAQEFEDAMGYDPTKETQDEMNLE